MTLRSFLFLALLTIVPAATGFAAAPMVVPDPSGVLATLKPAHPRLMLDDAGLARLRETLRNDPTAARYWADVLREADALCAAPVLSYTVKEDNRLLSVSRQATQRMYTLGLAWRVTGERRYAERAEQDLLAVCAFENWTPSLATIYPLQARHREFEQKYGQPPWSFLDVAEMCHAVGIGYDWFYHFLSPASRTTIKTALLAKGLRHGVNAYTGVGTATGAPDAWTTYNHNWNLVCNGGLLVGALAVAETNPEVARVVVPGAVKSLPLALTTYGPDGAWPEGPSYWDYATSFMVYGIAALDSALGTDYGLSALEGLDKTGYFPLLTTGPTGLYLNFADSRERNALRSIPCLFWLARRYGNTFFSDQEHAMIRRERANPLHLVWYVPDSSRAPAERALDAYFRGPTEVAVFRSGWDSPAALFVGVKAGDNTFNHANLDLGTFELDALGVRWARDLGSDNYSLPGYFDFYYLSGKTGGGRWTYYRMGSRSHSVPVINGEHQDELAAATFRSHVSRPDGAHVIVDLGRAYERHVTRAERGVAMMDRRRAVLVQDEFELRAPAEIGWGMMTDATITLAGRRAILRQEGKTLFADILAPAGAVFSVESAEQKPPEAINRGVQRLRVQVSGEAGPVQIAVLLRPQWEAGEIPPAATNLRVGPLAGWTEQGP